MKRIDWQYELRITISFYIFNKKLLLTSLKIIKPIARKISMKNDLYFDLNLKHTYLKKANKKPQIIKIFKKPIQGRTR